MSKIVIIAGGSGLIGSHLISLLIENEHISQIKVLVRQLLPIAHSKIQQIQISFDSITNYSEQITGDYFYCCLGTTQAKTPIRDEYYKIDHDYPVELAKIAAHNKVSQYHFVSSIGANADSFSFYTKTKGETENDLKKINFESLHIYQPSLLTGNRTEKRIAERFFTVLVNFINPILIGSLQKYRSIKAKTVAQAIINQSLKELKGSFTYTSDHIQKLA